jgi:TonB family protein
VFSCPEVMSARAWFLVVSVGLVLHVSLALGLGNIKRTHAAPDTPISIEFVSEDVPRPVPPPPKENEVLEPNPPSTTQQVPGNPGARAQAGQILAAHLDSAEDADPASSFVSGQAAEFAGGVTDATGTSDRAVVDAPAPPAPPPPPTKPPVVERSHAATVASTRAYLAHVRQALAAHKRYPIAAQRAEIEGNVVVQLAIDAQGAFSGVSVVRSSGSELLDRAALESVRALSGRIARPRDTGELSLPLKASIRFAMER